MRKIHQTFTPILELLDEGLRLYRRNLTRFLLLVALLALPTGTAVGALFLAADQMSATVSVFIILAVILVSLPLSLYIMGALSRAAVMAAAGEPVHLRQALAIRPLRVLSMGCYGTFFLMVASFLVSMLSLVFVCATYLIVVMGVIAISAIGSTSGAVGEATASLFIFIAVFAVLASYVVSLVVNGAVYGSVVYALQPFVQDQIGSGEAVRRSIDLVTYRLGYNLLAFLSASLVFGAAALATTLAIGFLVPLPMFFLLGEESPIARAITAAAWVTGIAAAVPLLPIWMALLYQRHRVAHRGEDLAARISALA